MSQPGYRTRILALALVLCGALAADPLDDLARDFWQWRAIHQPVSGDDMARMDRPADWTPDWSAQSVAQQKEALASFEKRWKEMDAGRFRDDPHAIPKRVLSGSDRRVADEQHGTYKALCDRKHQLADPSRRERVGGDASCRCIDGMPGRAHHAWRSAWPRESAAARVGWPRSDPGTPSPALLASLRQVRRRSTRS